MSKNKTVTNYLIWIVICISFIISSCSKQPDSNTTTEIVNTNSKKTISGMVLIPAGDFFMGSDDIDASGKSEEFGFNEPWYLNEHPKHKVYLDDYYIDINEVSNGDYKSFLETTGQYSDEQINEILTKFNLTNAAEPLRNVSWHDADSFCKAMGKQLPTEAQWEKAARGPDGFEFPWGNDWNPDYVNAGGEEQDVMPVASYEKGKSTYGLYDMAGNVMEWVDDWYEAYPGAEYKSPRYGKQRKVVRGGGWGGIGHYVIPHFFRMAYRYNYPPDQAFNDIGFRCAKNATK